jgi:SAM-dependent methyltransferase
MLRKLLSKLIDTQRWLSRQFDRLLPARFQVDGNRDFVNCFVPCFLETTARRGMTVYDVGGGKRPVVPAAIKAQWGLRTVGVDICPHELSLAPAGAYDEVICADVCRYQGRGDADLVICRAMLEHVPNVEAALGAISTMLKPGGIALVFAPSRNAAFARLNLALPESFKRWLLFTIFPDKQGKQGFPAFYDRCTPRQVKRLAQRSGLCVDAERRYYLSSYFSCFLPCHVAWRLWLLTFFFFDPEESAETFCLALRKPHAAATLAA